jgi:hypothetical protein
VYSFDLGKDERREEWIEPWGAPNATLAAVGPTKAKMSIGLQIRAASPNAAILLMEAIRDRLNSPTVASTFSYSPATGVAARTITLYPSAIDPAPLPDPESELLLRENFIVVTWDIEVWRRPLMASIGSGGTTQPVL